MALIQYGQRMPKYETLLLDLGGVCLLNPVELHEKLEVALGLPSGTFTWLGPIDPSTDNRWQAMVSGTGMNEREYWASRASDVGRASGQELSLQDYMKLIYEPPGPELIRPGAMRTVELALAAGIGVSIFTNDMRTFHGHEWEKGLDFLGLVDHIIDCSDTGMLKPDPRSYERAIGIVGSAPENILFVDDQPGNVAGGSAAGLAAVWFDIANAEHAWANVAAELGLSFSRN